jgi:hypothetical protein
MRTTLSTLYIAVLILSSSLSSAQEKERPGAQRITKGKLVVRTTDDPNRKPSPTKKTIDDGVLIDGKLYQAVVENGDTMPLVNLPLAQIKAERVFRSKREKRRYKRLEKNVRKVYPFAKLANEKLLAYEHRMEGMTESRRKKFLRKAEKDIRKEFEGELKAMTFTQGRILLKLIDRETGEASYELVKTLRGGFTAWIFQGVAKIFKFDLKSKYNADEDDRFIL